MNTMKVPFPDQHEEEMPACWRPTPMYSYVRPPHRHPSTYPPPLHNGFMPSNPMYSYEQPHRYMFDAPHREVPLVHSDGAFQPTHSGAPSPRDHVHADNPPFFPPGMHHHVSPPPVIYIPEECEELPPPPPLRTLFEDINEADVLCGRGAPTGWHPGNRYFRSLISHYQSRYLAARRADKPEIAMSIVKLVKDRGGRFLKRVKVHGTGAYGHFCWQDIGEQRSYEKACQALREGAPEIRRRLSAKDRLHLAKESTRSRSPDGATSVTTDEARDDV